MKKTFIPSKFKERYNELFENDALKFFEYCERKLRKTIRINSLKISVDELLKLFEQNKIFAKKLSFSDYCFLVEDPPMRLGMLLEHSIGFFAIQEISSMIPSIVLNPKPGEKVLDLTAAPGMKTTHLAQLMNNEGLIIAIDISASRIKSLKYNLQRLGVINAIVLQQNALNFNSSFLFDKILLDAPCSSEGLIRKRFDALKNWSENLIQKKSVLQKKLLLKAFSLLKPGGILVYSTCTVAPEENEEVVNYLLTKHSNALIEETNIDGFVCRKGFLKWRNNFFKTDVKNCLRIFPQDNNSESFFVAKIRKAD